MRSLETHDVFIALRIINRTDLKEKIKGLATRIQAGEELSQEDVGYELIFDAIAGCSNPTNEADIYELLGGLLEINPIDIKRMNPLELIEKIKQLKEVIPVEDWKAFFHSLSALLK